MNLNKFIERLPSTAQLRMFGITKIPLMFLVNPTVEEMSEKSCKVRVPLNYITRNHLKSMYFGALAIGADTVVGVFALNLIKEFQDLRVTPIFKDLKADFLKRAEADVVFECHAGEQIRSMIQAAHHSGQRVTESVNVVARCPSLSDEPVATFDMGLSIRVKEK